MQQTDRGHRIIRVADVYLNRMLTSSMPASTSNVPRDVHVHAVIELEPGMFGFLCCSSQWEPVTDAIPEFNAFFEMLN